MKSNIAHSISYLSLVRGPLRNDTMHLEKTFDAESSREILDAATTFFKYLPRQSRESKTGQAVKAGLLLRGIRKCCGLTTIPLRASR